MAGVSITIARVNRVTATGWGLNVRICDYGVWPLLVDLTLEARSEDCAERTLTVTVGRIWAKVRAMSGKRC